MEIIAEQICAHLSKCRHIINKGYTNIQDTRLPWLNVFCLEFLKVSQKLHKFLSLISEGQAIEKGNGQVDIIYLCLTQIMCCIRYMECTIQAEDSEGKAISASRQHFLDRIHWCLDRLRTCIKSLETSFNKSSIAEENTIVDLMDNVFDYLTPYTSYKNNSNSEFAKEDVNVAEDRAEAMFASKEIRSTIDLILSHTLAFANVALKQDKKALSALCQKVLRECMAFQEECALCVKAGVTVNESNRRLRGISLENALYQLEDYINEALLRLVYTCFLDFDKLSVEKLRAIIRQKDPDDPELDELIADFDVNIDRTTQIGIFAIAFAPTSKIKTIVRSCLASFECLDSCIIPSLQSKCASAAYSHLLQQHFNDEVSSFKLAIQEIIDSQAFTSCYHDLLTQVITSNDKEYNKQSLLDIIQMGNFLYDHFQLAVNMKALHKNADRMEHFKKFTLMLHECQAILKCADSEEVQPQRILKRFKILRSVLRKLLDDFGGNAAAGKNSQVFLLSDELSDSQRMFESIGISPSIRSILYNNSPSTGKRARLSSDSLKANYSKLPLLSPPSTASSNINQENMPTKSMPLKHTINSLKSPTNMPGSQMKRLNMRRKESMRTAMFKRQKTEETEEVYDVYRNNSESLQISEILEELTKLSSNYNESVLDKSTISK